MSDKPMTILVVEPMKRPYVQEIDGSLESMQKLVGGDIQALYPYDDPVALVCHGEGKFIGLPPNRLLRDEQGQPYDMICGTFFVVGLSQDDFTSLSPEMTQKYTEKFGCERLLVIPKIHEKKENDLER